MDDSPLSTIPPELRTYIYEFCLITHPDPIVIEPSQPAVPALLQTCRQIRKECESLYYASNTFLIEPLRTSPNEPCTFAEWFSIIGTENSKILKNVIVETASYPTKPELNSPWVDRHISINRIRDIGRGIGGLKVRLSYLKEEIKGMRRPFNGEWKENYGKDVVLELDLRDLMRSLKKQIKAVKRLLKEEEDVDEYMYLSYAKLRLERLLELEEPEVVDQVERKRREDMKRALGIPV